MKELLIIAVGAAIVNNVVLSQFLGICAFLGVSKKTETAAGMGGAVIFVITLSSFVTGLIYKYTDTAQCPVFADDRIYFSHCSVSAVSRDVFEKIHSIVISGARCLPASDHNQLCRIRCSIK